MIESTEVIAVFLVFCNCLRKISVSEFLYCVDRSFLENV